MASLEQIDAARTMLAALGITPEDLMREAPAMPSLGAYIERTTPNAAAGVAKTYGTYWEKLKTSGLAPMPLNGIKKTDLEGWLAAVRDSRVIRRNSTGGGSTTENAIRAARWVFTRAVEDGLIITSPAAHLVVPRRRPRPRRALTPDELRQLAEVTRSGGNDPELDTLILRFHLESGARRGGAIALRLRDLDHRRSCVRLREKGGSDDWQPVSPGLLDALDAHARYRGASGPDDAVLRYRNGNALTRRRYNTYIERCRTALPWFAIEDVCGHWLRHTAVDMVRTVSTEAVATRFARHVPSTVTGQYGRATESQVATVVAALTGEPHPLAPRTTSLPAHLH